MRVRYTENLDLTNFRKNNQIIRYIEGWLIIFLFKINFFLWYAVVQPCILGPERLLFITYVLKKNYINYTEIELLRKIARFKGLWRQHCQNFVRLSRFFATQHSFFRNLPSLMKLARAWKNNVLNNREHKAVKLSSYSKYDYRNSYKIQFLGINPRTSLQ